ncbi:MAG: sugar transferase [Bacteroidia bacterium]|nr:sugar transferase [Bacteroidia bacterium]
MSVSVISSILALLLLRLVHDPINGFQHYIIIWVLINAACTLLGFVIFGTYKLVIRYSSFKSIGRLTASVVVSDIIMACIIATGLLKAATINVEIFTLILDALLTITFLLVVRVIIIKIIESLSTSVDEKLNCLNVLVYGTGNKSIAMLTRLEDSTHYDVVGIITDDKGCDGQIFSNKKAHCVRSAEDLAALKSTLGVEGVIFASEEDAINEKESIISFCISQGVSILNVPKIGAAAFHAMNSGSARKMAASEEYIRDGMTSFEKNTTRLVDMVIAGICLIVFSPLFLIIYIAIKREDHGPAIYKQERIGRFGRPFYIYKFRSMRPDAESMGPALYSGDEDPRLTKVGKFIRAHHLDELPQLWNVLCGEMAFVGPRPERKFYIDQIMEVDPRYYYLYQIRPGVTSYATLYNGYTDTIEKMVKRLDYDIYYLKNRSWWFDIKILGMTFMSIVFGKKF